MANRGQGAYFLGYRQDKHVSFNKLPDEDLPTYLAVAYTVLSLEAGRFNIMMSGCSEVVHGLWCCPIA